MGNPLHSETVTLAFDEHQIRSTGRGWEVNVDGRRVLAKEVSIAPPMEFFQQVVKDVHYLLIGRPSPYPQLSLPHPFEVGKVTHFPFSDLLDLTYPDKEIPARKVIVDKRQRGRNGSSEPPSVAVVLKVPSARKTADYIRKIRAQALEYLRTPELIQTLTGDEDYQEKERRVRAVVVATDILLAYYGVRYGLEYVKTPGYLSGKEDEIRLLSHDFRLRLTWPAWIQKLYDTGLKGERRELEGIGYLDNDGKSSAPCQSTTKRSPKSAHHDPGRTAFYLRLDGFRELRSARENNPFEYTIAVFDTDSPERVVVVLTSPWSENAAYFFHGELNAILDSVRKRRSEIRSCCQEYMGRIMHRHDGSWRSLIPEALKHAKKGERFFELRKHNANVSRDSVDGRMHAQQGESTPIVTLEGLPSALPSSTT